MNYKNIINEYLSKDKRYPIANLELVLSRVYPKEKISTVTKDKSIGSESFISVGNLMTWIYLSSANTYSLAVRFRSGLYWIQLESNETCYPELTEDVLTELKWYTDQLTDMDKLEPGIFKYESESGEIYVQDVNKVTCTCPNFKYRTSHFPIDDERRMCKHLESIYRLFPEDLPDAIKLKDSQRAMASMGDKTRYPRSIFDLYVDDIKSTLNQFTNLIERCEVCGSYRRLSPMVSDLDILIQLRDGADWEPLLDYIENIKQWSLIKNIGRGSAKAAYMIDGFIHVDFKCVDKSSWPFALMHFTGSKSTNIEMRRIANSRGYKLNEYGLFNELTGDKVEGLTTERSVYEFLGVSYKEPWDR